MNVAAHQIHSSQTLQDLMKFPQMGQTMFALSIRYYWDERYKSYHVLENESILKLFYPILHIHGNNHATHHTSCYVHVYLTEDQLDVDHVVHYFFREAEYNDEDPHYILLWDNFPSHNLKSWEGSHVLFNSQVFFGKFTGFRFLIQSGLVDDQQKVGLICMICNEAQRETNKPVINYFSTKLPPIPLNIRTVWKQLHRNHHGLNIPHICNPWPCRISTNGRKFNGEGPLFVEHFVHQILIAKYNITSTSEKRRLLDQRGMITRSLIFPSVNIETFFLTLTIPRYILSPYGVLPQQYHLFTVMDNELILSNWNILFKPFDTTVWSSFAISYIASVVICIMVYLSWNNETEKCFKLYRIIRSMLFCLLCIVIDQHHRRKIVPRLTPILLLWTWLCFILNSAYKGNLFSELSTNVEPWVPTDLLSLVASGLPILSTSGLYFTMQDNYVPDSLLKYDIKSYLELNGKINGSGYLHDILHKLNFCLMKDAREKGQFLKSKSCQNKEGQMTTFSGSFSILDMEKGARNWTEMFKAFSNKWVSAVQPINEFPSWNPWLIQKTYFANLVMPVLAQWYESGVGKYWDTIAEKELPIRALQGISGTGMHKLRQNNNNRKNAILPGESTGSQPKNLDSGISLMLVWPIKVCCGILLTVSLITLVFEVIISRIKLAVNRWAVLKYGRVILVKEEKIGKCTKTRKFQILYLI